MKHKITKALKEEPNALALERSLYGPTSADKQLATPTASEKKALIFILTAVEKKATGKHLVTLTAL